MKTNKFPHIALAIGFFLFLMVSFGTRLTPDGNTTLPLLVLLIACELGFIVTLIGGYVCFKHITSGQNKYSYIAMTFACLILALQFLLRGISLWPS